MNKRNTRAFAFGVLISVLIMGFAYFFNKDDLPENAKLDESAAKAFLKREGYIVLTDEEHANLQKSLQDPKETTAHEADQTQKEPSESPTAYQLEIASGMTPGEIAEQLEKENIVEDAAEFGDYLEEYGYSKKIQLGTFELTNQMSFKDIAKTITKS
ncbi:endolytic transglycosylase MltG [Bacillus sp. ISL-47]|uniref:endolytic transglycosylase MltG n=1 Tax=Bacillus sp. ISL-47 TaxID=2819130 RepID=UPI001BE5D8A1|nr:endolytic transglycosylase MltG [Bacillus sp. ISL-47]MBT2687125.1 endolytic transglycosylase MltG [Bacillus sp. ISL-47]MBT2710475.1 endolytic transglycosylase MltG [Pseudomonas sp. ISL-84]